MSAPVLLAGSMFVGLSWSRSGMNSATSAQGWRADTTGRATTAVVVSGVGGGVRCQAGAGKNGCGVPVAR
jgi:hypothetical protein